MGKDGLPRLRAEPLPRPPRIVLVDPEIPQNTGNIARLAAALACPLHLVGQLGFRIDEKAVRRAGLDYWHLVEIHQHASLEEFAAAYPTSAFKLFSAVAPRSYLQAPFGPDDALLFGKESSGLPQALLDGHPDSTFAVPTIGGVRSLNLANTVAVVAYEAFRQLGAFADVALGP